MRTTIDLDRDVEKAVAQLRRERGIGASQAVNELIRRGLLPRPEAPPFRQRTTGLGLRIDFANVAAALEDLEGPEAR